MMFVYIIERCRPEKSASFMLWVQAARLLSMVPAVQLPKHTQLPNHSQAVHIAQVARPVQSRLQIQQLVAHLSGAVLVMGEQMLHARPLANLRATSPAPLSHILHGDHASVARRQGQFNQVLLQVAPAAVQSLANPVLLPPTPLLLPSQPILQPPPSLLLKSTSLGQLPQMLLA